MNDGYKKYRNALKELQSTPNGKYLLDYLNMVYGDASALDINPHVMAYKLGQKELIQAILEDSKTDYIDQPQGNIEYE